MSETKPTEAQSVEAEIRQAVNGFIAKPDKTMDVEKVKLAIGILHNLSDKLVDAVSKEFDRRQAELDKMRSDFIKTPPSAT